MNFRMDAGKDDDKEKQSGLGRRMEDAFSDARFVLITGEINDKVARDATSRLLALAQMSDDPINVMISSPGGHVESGDMIHDVIRFIRPKVNAIGSGWVASAGALIFVAVPKERRFCLPKTRFLLHEPRGGVGGQASDIEIQANEIRKMRERFYEIFSEATGQSIERLQQDMDRDFWLNTDEAIDYGLLGKVITSVNELN
ncbi:ATP-dependent Clp protease proteolytic subunit [Ahrensia marina]|uniref:ATP-dependent Clp protease proteolytic subunit n=1 Tax=Ahrensia marina TaxID=1514904 RepID=UPI0035D0B4E9